MRHVLMPCVLVLSGCWFVGSAGAQQSCNAPAGTFDRVYCDAKLLIRADDEMNVAYQKLLKRLNAQGQQVLRHTDSG
ncbi:hypothetical protein [Deinococcus xianganensis]|uniref:hypothetical protein n=1 Tax=Deinococcus xianganensis TaxID=1507289 RepID=UPI0019293935|nr:hypothetical protein [Deinococcus xianganensis]